MLHGDRTAAEPVEDDSGTDQEPFYEGTLPERGSAGSTASEDVTERTAILANDHYFNYAQVDMEEFERAVQEGE